MWTQLFQLLTLLITHLQEFPCQTAKFMIGECLFSVVNVLVLAPSCTPPPPIKKIFASDIEFTNSQYITHRTFNFHLRFYQKNYSSRSLISPIQSIWLLISCFCIWRIQTRVIFWGVIFNLNLAVVDALRVRACHSTISSEGFLSFSVCHMSLVHSHLISSLWPSSLS